MESGSGSVNGSAVEGGGGIGGVDAAIVIVYLLCVTAVGGVSFLARRIPPWACLKVPWIGGWLAKKGSKNESSSSWSSSSGASAYDVNDDANYALNVYNGSSNHIETAETYFLADRKASWWLVGPALFSSNIGGEHMVGLASAGATVGLSVAWFEFTAVYCLILLGWVFVPHYLRLKVFTMPEYLEKRYSRTTRRWLAGLSLLLYVATKVCVTLFSASVVLRVVLDWNEYVSAILLLLLTGLYVTLGGLRAVIWTELVQTVVLVVGALMLVVKTMNLAGGWSAVKANVPDTFFHVWLPADSPDFPWPAVVFGIPAASVWYWCADQVIVQRALSAKNVGHARGGVVLAAFLKLTPMFLFVMPGVIARSIIPTIDRDPNIAFPFLLTMMPKGVRGMILAAMLSALMSSLASVLNSTSTIAAMDIYRDWNPRAKNKRLVFVGRVAAVIMVVVSFAWLPLIPRISSDLLTYFQTVSNIFAPPIAVVFVLGVLTKFANGTGALSSLIVGFALGALRFILEVTVDKPPEVGLGAIFIGSHYLYFALFLAMLCTVVHVCVSLASREYMLCGEMPLEPSEESWEVGMEGDGTISARLILASVDPASSDSRDRAPERALANALNRAEAGGAGSGDDGNDALDDASASGSSLSSSDGPGIHLRAPPPGKKAAARAAGVGDSVGSSSDSDGWTKSGARRAGGSTVRRSSVRRSNPVAPLPTPFVPPVPKKRVKRRMRTGPATVLNALAVAAVVSMIALIIAFR